MLEFMPLGFSSGGVRVTRMRPSEKAAARASHRSDHYLYETTNRLILDCTDNDPRALREGILALQLHAGKPFWVEFKAIRIKAIE